MEKIRFGIVGVGNQGSTYMLKLFDREKIKNGVVTAVCDINPAKIEAIREKTVNENVTYFSDYETMLDSGLIDACIIATPTMTTRSWPWPACTGASM
jgi:predicted dehydrogenase